MKNLSIGSIVVAAAALAVLTLAPATADGQATADATAKPKGGPFPQQLTVYDRAGKVLSTVGAPAVYDLRVLSPDGTRLAVTRADPGIAVNLRADIWVFDLSTGASTQITSESGPTRVRSPLWSPDGSQVAFVARRQIVFVDRREDYFGVYRKASNGTGSEELLYRHTPAANMMITDWSADGRFLCRRRPGRSKAGRRSSSAAATSARAILRKPSAKP